MNDLDVMKQIEYHRLQIQLLNKKLNNYNIKDQILKVVCNVFEVNERVIKGKSRGHKIVMVRNAYIWLLKRNTNLLLREIGDGLNKDHSTIIWALKRAQADMDTIPEYKEKIKRCKDILGI